MKVPPDDRPREKLARLGAAALGDNELLAIVMGHESVELANAVLHAAARAQSLTRMTVDDLQQIKGVGPAKAAQIVAATELGRRTLVRPGVERLRFRTAREAAEYIIPLFGARAIEQFGVLMLDIKHHLLRVRIIASGSLDTTLVNPRDVFREAAIAQAAAVIVFHNHPSGDPTPSKDDALLTRRLVQAGYVIGIDMVDHVIVADQRYYSFREAGRL